MIRFIVGLVLMFGVAGRSDNDATFGLLPLIMYSMVALALIAWPVVDGTLTKE